MSSRLDANHHFISLLLETTTVQARALLYTLSEDQVLVLREIAHNLNTLPLPVKVKKEVLKSEKLLTKLGTSKGSWKSKRILIENNYKKLSQLFITAKPLLKTLLP